MVTEQCLKAKIESLTQELAQTMANYNMINGAKAGYEALLKECFVVEVPVPAQAAVDEPVTCDMENPPNLS